MSPNLEPQQENFLSAKTEREGDDEKNFQLKAVMSKGNLKELLFKTCYLDVVIGHGHLTTLNVKLGRFHSLKQLKFKLTIKNIYIKKQ